MNFSKQHFIKQQLNKISLAQIITEGDEDANNLGNIFRFCEKLIEVFLSGNNFSSQAVGGVFGQHRNPNINMCVCVNRTRVG